MRYVNQSATRGFTLAELVIGLVVLALVGGATSAVALAVSRGWQAGETNATSNLVITRTMIRIQDKLKRAKVVGEWRAGSVSSNVGPGAAVLFWRDDDNADGQMQLDETQLLEYDATAQQLVVHEASFPNPTTRAAHNGPFDSTMLSNVGAIDTYKAMVYKKRYAITNGVRGASFNVINPSTASQRRTFEFTLKFRGANGDSLEYGTAAAHSTGT